MRKSPFSSVARNDFSEIKKDMKTVKLALRDIKTQLSSVKLLETSNLLPNTVVNPTSDSDEHNLHACCPSYMGQHAVSRVYRRNGNESRWARVSNGFLFHADVVEWIKRNPLWKLDGKSCKQNGTVVIQKAYCTCGGSSIKYMSQIERGVKTANRPLESGFAASSSLFERCPCRLRVAFIPGECVLYIEVSLNDQFTTHNHGELHLNTRSISAYFIQVDPTMFIYNVISEFCQHHTFYNTSPILSRITTEIHRQRRGELFAVIGTRQFRSRLQKLMRVYRGHTRFDISGLYEMKKSNRRKYREALRNFPEGARHFPQIIGLSHAHNSDGELVELVVTISTDSLLEHAFQNAKISTFCTDCTFKRVQSGHPILTMGCVSDTREYILTSISIVLRESSFSYKNSFSHTKGVITDSYGPFEPEFLLGDAAAAITHGATRIFPLTKRLVCYAHMKKQVKLTVRYKCSVTNTDWYELREHLTILARAKSESQFAHWLDCLVRLYSNNERLVEYLKKSRGYFDVDSWRSKWYWGSYSMAEQLWGPRTNNAQESFNSRLKSGPFQNRIVPFADALNILTGSEIGRFSCESIRTKHLDYFVHPQLWRAADSCTESLELIQQNKHLLNASLDGSGDIYFCSTLSGVQFSENEKTDLISGLYDPFLPKYRGSVLFIPHSQDKLNSSPPEGGPICTCDKYVTQNMCYHVCLAWKRLKNFQPSLTRRVGTPLRAFGATRPRTNSTPALHRMN